jgi:hypothetical protein
MVMETPSTPSTSPAASPPAPLGEDLHLAVRKLRGRLAMLLLISRGQTIEKPSEKNPTISGNSGE